MEAVLTSLLHLSVLGSAGTAHRGSPEHPEARLASLPRSPSQGSCAARRRRAHPGFIEGKMQLIHLSILHHKVPAQPGPHPWEAGARGCPKLGPHFLGCAVGAGPLQPSRTKELVWTAACTLPSGQASQSTSGSGNWGQIKIINNNNRPLRPLQKQIAMATTCWQRCCLRPGGMCPHHHHHHPPVWCQMRSAPPTLPLGTKEILQLWRNSPKATTFAVPRGHGAVPILLPVPRTMSPTG